mmetsp:Transcript_22070/g.69031  ORF Transcript_22070/g.69031 Transcript_22070/m.69031 type:complete len:219 (+) Transcript_22070:2124-2780(+)
MICADTFSRSWLEPTDIDKFLSSTTAGMHRALCSGDLRLGCSRWRKNEHSRIVPIRQLRRIPPGPWRRAQTIQGGPSATGLLHGGRGVRQGGTRGGVVVAQVADRGVEVRERDDGGVRALARVEEAAEGERGGEADEGGDVGPGGAVREAVGDGVEGGEGGGLEAAGASRGGGVESEDLSPGGGGGGVDPDGELEAARSEEGGVEEVEAIGGREGEGG